MAARNGEEVVPDFHTSVWAVGAVGALPKGAKEAAVMMGGL